MATYYCTYPGCIGHDKPSDVCDSAYINLKLFVYVFENAPLRGPYRRHVQGAVEIWKKGGIQFWPTYQEIKKAQLVQLIGPSMTLDVPFNYLFEGDKEPGRTQRERLRNLRGRDWRFFAVFFVNAKGDSVWETKADPRNDQAYICRDFDGCPFGRTVAHELGHLFLGSGHTGDRDAPPPSSDLMIAGNKPGGSLTDISEDDAKLAKQVALGIATKSRKAVRSR